MSVSVFESLAGLLVGWTVRATALLVIAFAGAVLLRRSSARLRHALWAATFLALAVVPLASFAPAWNVPVLAAPEGKLAPAVPPDPAWRKLTGFRLFLGSGPLPEPRAVPAAPSMEQPKPPAAFPFWKSWQAWAGGLWLVGFAFLLGRALYGRRIAARFREGSIPADPVLWGDNANDRHVALRESDTVDLPVTVGAWRPTILVPAAGRDWPSTWRQAAVEHERAHLRHRDPALQVLVDVVTAVFWFHPLVWRAERQLRIERELAADDAALSKGARASDYSQLLIELAAGPGCAPARGAVVPLLTKAGLKARLLGLLDEQRQRKAARSSLFALAVCASGLTLPTALAVPVRGSAVDHESAGAWQPSTGGGSFVLARALDVGGNPVAGAEVHIPAMLGPSLRLTSDAHGWITHPNPAPGRHVTFDVYVRKGNLAVRKGIYRVPYGTELPVELVLRPASSLSGRVRTLDGKGVPGVEVRIGEWQNSATGPGAGPLAATDADGRFRVEGILYGTYRLVFSAPSGALAHHAVRVEQADVDGLDVTIGVTETVTAFLEDDQGRPLEGVVVHRHGPWWRLGERSEHSFPAGERHMDWDRSDHRGAVRLAPRGRMLFAETKNARGDIIGAAFPDGGAPIGRLDGSTPRGRPMTLSVPRQVRLEPPVRISGHVRYEDGRPAVRAGLRVDIPRVAGFTMGTDDHGAFTVPRLPFRKVVLQADRSAARTELDLAPGEVRQVEMVLPSSAQ